MAVEREASKEEISTFASLLKTFLPDQGDLPLTGSTEELLQHVKGSMQENVSSEHKQVKGKDGQLISQSHLKDGPFKKHSSHRLDGTNNISCDTVNQPANSSHCNRKEQFTGSSHNSIPVKLVGISHCDINKQQTGGRQNIVFEQLADDNQYNASELHVGSTPYKTAKQLTSNSKLDADVELTNSISHPAAVDYDSDATLDAPYITESHTSVLPGEDNCNNTEFNPVSSMSPQLVKHYACFVCDETFPELTPYAIHMTSHNHKIGSIKCGECGETLDSKPLFFAHRKLFAYELWTGRGQVSSPQTIDTENFTETSTTKTKRRKKGADEIFFCSVCGKHFNRYSAFLKHMRTHKGDPAFTCAVCQESFRASCLLRNHVDLQHSHVQPFQCNRCLRRFKLKCSLSTHLRYCDIDPGSLPFAEEMQFIDQLSQQRKYQGLEAEAEGMSQYSCPICMLMFDSPEDLKSHMSYHDETKPYKCEQCGRGFRSRHVLRKHASVHATKHECRCEICGVQLLTLSGYNAHLRGHQNQEKIQAQFFPASSQEVKDDNVLSESAVQILQRIKCPSGNKSEETTEECTPQHSLVPKPTASKKNKNYKCPICGMLFFTGGVKFQLHARKEHKDAIFEKCKLCSKSFVGKDNLEKHVRLHNMFADSYSCDECGKTFRRKFAMQVHKKMHSFKKFVKCDICGQEFRFVSEVDKHKNKIHRYDRLVNIYKCSICGQRFPMLSHLSVHCYCHNLPGAKPFECDLCKLSYHTSVELKKHIFEKHDKLMNKMECISDTEDTFRVFPNAEDSDNEVGMTTREQTDTERMKNVAQSNINNKESSLKLELQSAKLGESKDKKTNDGILAKEYIKTEVSYPEEKNENREATLPIKLEGTLPSNVEAYNLATRQFYHQSKFLKRYTCEVCQKAFSSNSDLKTHRRTHSGETPFKCDFCDRSFKQRGHRKLHIQVVHTKEMPYKCDQCDSAFPTRYRYQIHIKRHSGVREHQCSNCDKGFYTQGKLNEHMKKRHPEEWKKEQEEKDKLNE